MMVLGLSLITLTSVFLEPPKFRFSAQSIADEKTTHTLSPETKKHSWPLWSMFIFTSFISLLVTAAICPVWNDTSMAALADEISPMTPAATQGLAIGSNSLGFAVGTICVGWLFEYRDIAAVMNFLAISGTFILFFGSIVTLWRKRINY